jgi:hypothetical protein
MTSGELRSGWNAGLQYSGVAKQVEKTAGDPASVQEEKGQAQTETTASP